MRNLRVILAGMVLSVVVGSVTAQEIVPSAILSFKEQGRGVKDFGPKVESLLFAELVVEQDLWLVERSEIDQLLQEAELTLSGMVNPAQATQVGQLTGAKILITGSVIEVDTSLILVAKVIGTETSRVLGQKVTGSIQGELAPLVEKLATKVAQTIRENASELVAKTVSTEDRIASLNESLGDAKRRALQISVTERHVGQATIDPAAETELILMSRKTGFPVVDPTIGREQDVDILITGEGFSEFAMRRGNLVSVKARVEVKAVDRKSGEIIATDRQTAIRVDLSEQIAGKAALQEASAIIAGRLLPQLTSP